VRPRLILAMGRFAVQALLRSSEPVGKLRGKVHRYQGVPLVVTYHPAYLLRNLPDKARAWEDLCLAASRGRRRWSACPHPDDDAADPRCCTSRSRSSACWRTTCRWPSPTTKRPALSCRYANSGYCGCSA
jgi:hypothetical protein